MTTLAYYFGDAADLEGMTRTEVEKITSADPNAFADDFAEMLDESYPEITLGGVDYSYANVWQSTDPIAYELAYNEAVAEINLDDFSDDFSDDED